ncbi:hypothetical protein [Bowmanella yangjiangensis]|uniref:Uncharacterized protein n=1 Tax=Bowmanella yangjiangensis TaxID=2811230 RepID=A0ABS3CPJ8_9ALTE|nr:hypothetical protein [Bowmanella yangjiangensis]MBN7819005.1 hypothetical protein [Bowmanella yangjiangensis]
MEPDYTQYSLEELHDALRSVDQENYPERAQRIVEAISNKEKSLGVPPTPQIHADIAEPPADEKLHPNWFIRYWKGQVSLPVSYWVVGIATTLFVFGLSAFVQMLIGDADGQWQLGVYLLLLFTTLILLVVWQSVGVYRSASKHPQRGGSEVWAAIAKIMVVVGLIRFGVEMYQLGIPAIKEGVSLIVSQQKYPPTKLRLRNAGTELELYGGIEVGSEILLQEALTANPEVKLLHLHSQGGRLLGAYRLAELVKEYQLDTYVKESCSSACTIVYLAGTRRLLAEDGKLNFHAASMGGASLHEHEDVTAEMAAAYRESGVPDWFIKKIMSTPSEEFWTPSPDELLRGKVVDEVVDSIFYGFSGYGDDSEVTAEAVESGLLTHDYLVAMKEFDNEVYQDVVRINVEGMRSGLPVKDISQEFMALRDSRLYHYISHADDEAIIGYWKNMIAQMEELKIDYPLTCSSYTYVDEVPQEYHIGNAGKLSEAVQQQEFAALAALIRSQAPNRVVYSSDENTRLVTSIVEQLKAENEAYFDVIRAPENYISQPDLLCRVSIELQKGFISFDAKTSGTLLRTTYLSLEP